MYLVCSSMKWNHLPAPGALYDQHPKFLDDMHFIFQRKAHYQAKEQREAEARQKAAQRKR